MPGPAAPASPGGGAISRPAYEPGRISDPRYVRIFDTTLRDGEQSPGATMTAAQKLAIARQLHKLGVDVIEAGFPVSSPEEFEAVRAIAMEVGNDVGPDGFVPVICGMARTKPADLDRTWEAVRHARRPRVHTFIATSQIHMQYKLRMTEEQVIESAVSAVRHLRSLGCQDIEFCAEDAGRSEPAFLYRILGEVIRAGATTLNIPDTTGWTLTHEYGQLIAGIRANTPGVEGVVLATHCHNDLGLATANSMSGIMAGARQIECTLNGIGERAGMTCLEEVAMAIALRGKEQLGGLRTGINPIHIYPTSRLVAECSGMAVQAHKAIVGANAFAHESGIHQDGMLKNRSTYEIMSPETIGLTRDASGSGGIVMGKLSGRNALSTRLGQLGFELPAEELDGVFRRFKSLAERKKGITDQDLMALVAGQRGRQEGGAFAGGADGEGEGEWELLDLQVLCGTRGMPRCTVTLRAPDGNTHVGAGVGTGPVDAAYKAIDSLVRLEASLVDYTASSMTERGSQSVATACVKLRPAAAAAQEDGREPPTFAGESSTEDIVASSAAAYLHALNNMARWMALEGLASGGSSSGGSLSAGAAVCGYALAQPRLSTSSQLSETMADACPTW